MLAPEKSLHRVLLEFGKMEFVIGNYRNAYGLLSRGFQLFPSEWKLLLEQIHQLVGEERAGEPQIIQRQWVKALRLNQAALQLHRGAGRLWSTYIHVLHR